MSRATYEDRHHAIGLPDPESAIRFRMEKVGRDDLTPHIGNARKVAEILSGQRKLTLDHSGVRSPSYLGLSTWLLIIVDTALHSEPFCVTRLNSSGLAFSNHTLSLQ